MFWFLLLFVFLNTVGNIYKKDGPSFQKQLMRKTFSLI
jgi:hypothetical protein